MKLVIVELRVPPPPETRSVKKMGPVDKIRGPNNEGDLPSECRAINNTRSQVG